jgi:hypothetical protein
VSEAHDSQTPADRCCGDAAVYLLGLLDERQSDAFQEHARSCSVCSDELDALAPAVDRLPATVPQLPAPEHVKGRVMAIVRSEAATRSEAAARAEGSMSQPEWERDRLASRPGGGRLRFALRPDWRGGRFAMRAPALALAAAGLLAVGVAAGGLLTPFDRGTARVVSADVTLAGAHATLHQSGGHMWLTISQMPAPSSGHVYEVWVKDPGHTLPRPTDSLFTPTASGSGTVDVPGGAGASVVMVTQEPAGGSPLPTTTPVIVAHLS